MTTVEKKELLKEFLFVFNYEVMHEASVKNPNNEYFFAIISKKHIKKPEVHDFFAHYTSKYPVQDLSRASMEYKSEIEDKFYFVGIDTLNRNDVFYSQKKKFVEENANNIVCINMINEPADAPKHFSHNMENYVSQFKDMGVGAGLLAKDAIVEGIHKGRELFQQKSPELQQKAQELGNKITSKFNAFKKKF